MALYHSSFETTQNYKCGETRNTVRDANLVKEWTFTVAVGSTAAGYWTFQIFYFLKKQINKNIPCCVSWCSPVDPKTLRKKKFRMLFFKKKELCAEFIVKWHLKKSKCTFMTLNYFFSGSLQRRTRLPDAALSSVPVKTQTPLYFCQSLLFSVLFISFYQCLLILHCVPRYKSFILLQRERLVAPGYYDASDKSWSVYKKEQQK